MTALARELAAAARRARLDWTVEHVRGQLDQRGFTALADELLADPPGPATEALPLLAFTLAQLVEIVEAIDRISRWLSGITR